MGEHAEDAKERDLDDCLKDAEKGRIRRTLRQEITCKYCGAGGLRLKRAVRGWSLVGKEGQPHTCKNEPLPEVKPEHDSRSLPKFTGFGWDDDDEFDSGDEEGGWD